MEAIVTLVRCISCLFDCLQALSYIGQHIEMQSLEWADLFIAVKFILFN